MKRTFTKQPIVPKGWDGHNYNNWMKYVQKQIDRINSGSPQRLVKQEYGT